MKKAKIINQTLIYSISNYAVLGITFFIGLVTKRILNVSGAGEWAFILAFLPFGLYLDLGILNAISRQIPRELGGGDPAKAEKIKNVAFTFLVITGIIAIAVFFIASLFVSGNQTIKLGLSLLGFLVLFTLLYNLNIHICWATKEIVTLSKIIIINGIIVGIFNIALVIKFKAMGMVIGTILATILMFYIAKRLGGQSFRLDFNIREYGGLIKIGFPINTVAILVAFFMNIDKIVVGRFIGIDQLGLYTVALMATATTAKLPSAFSLVLFPYFQEEYGKHKNIMTLKDKYVRSLFCITRLLPALLVFICLFMSIIITYFLPRFIAGIIPMFILLLGYYFMLAKDMPYSLLYTINKQKMIVLIFMFILGSYVPAIIFVAKHNYGITGIAIATAIAYFCYFVCLFLLAFRYILTFKELLMELSGVMAIYLYAVTAFFLINRFIFFNNMVLSSFVKMVLFLILYLPIVVHVERKEGIFKLLAGNIRRKISI